MTMTFRSCLQRHYLSCFSYHWISLHRTKLGCDSSWKSQLSTENGSWMALPFVWLRSDARRIANCFSMCIPEGRLRWNQKFPCIWVKEDTCLFNTAPKYPQCHRMFSPIPRFSSEQSIKFALLLPLKLRQETKYRISSEFPVVVEPLANAHAGADCAIC